jgi:hypothetical protein
VSEGPVPSLRAARQRQPVTRIESPGCCAPRIPNVSRDSIDRHAFHEARGFAVFLVFIGLESGALSIARVQQRVQQGGHDVPDDRLRARFPRTLANLREAVTLAVRQQLV